MVIKGKQAQQATQTKDVSDSRKAILPYFWDLASLEESTRYEATAKLIVALKKLSVDEDGVVERAAAGDEESVIYSSDPDINYTVQRLIKGLSSGRKFARIGFATALLQVLKCVPSVGLDQVKKGISLHLKASKTTKGQEEKDLQFGRLFGLIVLAKAALSQSEPPMQEVASAVADMLTLQTKKVYLREITSTSICDILQQIPGDDFVEYLVPHFKSTMCSSWDTVSPDQLMVALKCSLLYEEKLQTVLTEKHWTSKDILHHNNFPKLAKVLAESSDYTLPRVHSFWAYILPMIMSSSETFPLFWTSIVEDVLTQSSHERKFLAMAVLQMILPKIHAEQVPVVFSPKLTKCITNAFSSKENYLFQAAKKFIQAMPNELRQNSNPGVAHSIVRHLITRSALRLRFDEGTKSKTIEHLVALFSLDEVNVWVEELKKMFLNDQLLMSDGERVGDIDEGVCRSWAANQLTAVVKSHSVPKAEALLMDIGKFLFLHAYFNVVKAKGKNPVLHAVAGDDEQGYHKHVRMRFDTVLKDLSHYHCSSAANGNADGKESGAKHAGHHLAGTLSNGEYIVYELVSFAKQLLSLPKYVALETAWQPEANEMFFTALEKIDSIRQTSPSSKSEKKAFELLLLHCIIRMFSSPNETIDVIQELIVCYNKTTESTPKKRKTAAEDEPHWTEVVTEILLSLLTQSSNLMRQVVDTVMSSIAAHMTKDAIKIVLDALEPRKDGADSQLQMEDSSDEDEDDDEEASRGSEEENDDEVDDDDADSDSDDEADDDSDNASDEEEEDDGNDAGVDEQLRQDIKAALGAAAAEEEDEEEDIDMDAVDESSLEAMDKALGAVFKARENEKSSKKSAKEMKRSVVHFKLRVLDIVELIIKRRANDAVVLTVIEPLLRVVTASSGVAEERNLYERAHGILKNQLCKVKSPKLDTSEADETTEIVKRVMMDAKDAPSVHVVSLMTSVVMFLIRVLRSCTSPDVSSMVTEEVGLCFKAALHHFMKIKQSHIQSVLFTELVKRFPDLAWQLVENLPGYCNEAINTYRKMQAIEILLQIVQAKPEHFVDNFKEHFQRWMESFTKFLISHSNETSFKSKQLSTFVKLLKKTLDEAKTLDMTDLVPVALSDALRGFIGGDAAARCPAVVQQMKKIAEQLESGSKKAGGAVTTKHTTKAKRKRRADDAVSTSTRQETTKSAKKIPRQKNKKKL